MTIQEIDAGGGDDGKVNSLLDDDAEPRDPPSFRRAKRKKGDSCLVGSPEEELEGADTVMSEVQAVLESHELRELENDVQANMVEPFVRCAPSSRKVTVADKETLSDIEDEEVDGYLNDDEEVKVKEQIWEHMNKDYIEQQERLERMKVDDPDQYRRLRPWRVKADRAKVRQVMRGGRIVKI